jgi:fermentation-respiration switch protein FrsA (DUF1100 family)
MYSESILAFESNLNSISKVPQNTSILIMNGENDTQTPVHGALLLQQKLTQINHPDHILITYPSLGHEFYPSSQWQTEHGPIPPYVLADLYSWLEYHSGFTRLPPVMPSSNSHSGSTAK